MSTAPEPLETGPGKLGVIAIGAGAWGSNVVGTLHDIDALAAIAEVDDEVRAELAERYPNLPLHADHHAALKEEAAAVAIATPAHTHHAIARDALLAGKDVYVEKPLTLTSEHARELVELAEERDRVLMVGHLLLYQPAIEWLKTYLADGHLGTVHSLHQERSKLGRVRRVENVLFSFGVHDLAVFLHLLGETPDTVQATGQRVLQDEVEDDVHLHLGFPSGARAHLHASWLWPETTRRLTVVGAEGMLVYDEVAGTITRHDATIDQDLASHHEGTELLFQDDGASQPLTRELEHFLACLRDRSTPRSPGEQGHAVVEILEHAQASMRRNRSPGQGDAA